MCSSDLASATGQFHLITNNTQIGYAGEVRTFAMGSCPNGWLYANGATVSAVTYSNLFAAIGSTWGSSAGNVVLPDFRNEFLRGDGASVVGTFEANDNKSHTHVATSVVTDPGHAHSYTYPAGASALSAGGVPVVNANTPSTTGSSTTGVTVATTNASTGGTEARPDNYRVRYCIEY